MTRTHRAFTALAIMAGAVTVAGAARLAIDRSGQLTEQQHTMTCLAAYVAFIRVMSSSEEEAIRRLSICEKSQPGEEPIQLDAREHPFLVERYEACMAAQLLLSTDLERSLKEQQLYCR